MLYAGQTFKSANGWQLLISTSGVRIDQYTKDQKWRVFAGYEGENRDYPTTIAGHKTWLIGCVINRYMGIRRHLTGDVYAETSIGVQKEKMEAWNHHHQKVESYETEYQPWGMLKVGIWVND